MKKINIYLAATVALLALAGCKREAAPEVSGEITVRASIGDTKVTNLGDASAFEAGDQIAVYVWMGGATEVPATRVVDGVKNTLGTDGKWMPEKPMLWKTVTDPHYFLGVFPARDITDFAADPYTLNPAEYTASDLLIATNLGGVKASGGDVPLVFSHAMAKLNVNLKFRSQWDATPTVTSVTVTAKKTATVNYLTKAVTASATETPAPVDIPAAATAATGYALSFSGLQVPQEGVTTVTVTIDGKTYVYESATDIPLVGGQYTTLGLVVGKDKIELGSISVTDWKPGTTLPDGDAVLTYKHNGHEYVDMGEVEINGVKKHLYWATCNVGADNPWDYGGYYAWGETATKDTYTWDNYAFMQDGQSDWEHITKYTFADGQTDGIWYDGGGNFIGDGKTSLADDGYADDAARQIWGGDWCIPTKAEWAALRNTSLYDWVWTNDYLGDGSNHAGKIVTRKNVSGTDPCAGNSIFLPAAGYINIASPIQEGIFGFYWSSSLYSGASDIGMYLYFYSYSGGQYDNGNSHRYYGRSLRPVFCERYPLAAADVASVDIGKVLAADGNIYADAAQATAAGTEARAVIAYVGSVPNYFDKFLAIAMEDVDGSSHYWAEAQTAVGTFAGTHAVTIGGTPYNTNAIGATYYDKVADNENATSATRTSGVVKGWRLPSVTDWRYIFEGFSGPTVASQPAGISDGMVYGNCSDIRNGINAACGNTALQSEAYWSSSEYSDNSDNAWYYDFYSGRFWLDSKAAKMFVTGIFFAHAVFAY